MRVSTEALHGGWVGMGGYASRSRSWRERAVPNLRTTTVEMRLSGLYDL